MKPSHVALSIAGICLAAALSLFTWWVRDMSFQIIEIRTAQKADHEWRSSFTNYARDANDLQSRFTKAWEESFDRKMASVFLDLNEAKKRDEYLSKQMDVAINELNDLKRRVSLLEAKVQ